MGGKRMAKKRKCGVLLPVSSLPSKYGIGCFDKKAYEFVDALKEAAEEDDLKEIALNNLVKDWLVENCIQVAGE